MRLDQNIKETNSYNIRSIYFDDYYDSYFFQNDAGVDDRFKIRIRIYDKSSELIKLEIKYKKNGYTKKESCRINEDLCKKVMNGEFISIDDCKSKVLYRLYIEQHMYLLKPKIIVEYDRTAYTSKTGNVRITFDRNIRYSKEINKFFENNLFSQPIMSTGQDVLEIKYDEFLPDYIASVLELNTLERTSFSKYYLSRLLCKENLYGNKRCNKANSISNVNNLRIIKNQ